MRPITRLSRPISRLRVSISRSGEASQDHGMLFCQNLSMQMPLLNPFGKNSPGRFYVSIVAKMVLSHFIMNYDIKLANPKASQSLAWSFALVPHPMTKLLVREKSNREMS